jgi:hypothetical protein
MKPEQSVKITYLKSPGFRTVHADGALGGETPDLNVFIAFWLQRGVIPDVTIHAVTPDGGVNPIPSEVTARSGGGIVREVDFGVVMTLDAAKSFHEWLGQKISAIEAISASRVTEGVKQ